MGNKALPYHLKGKRHFDYIWPLCYIPRAWTSYMLCQPPRVICGNNIRDWTARVYDIGTDTEKCGVDPVQKMPWAWVFSYPFHFTCTFGKSGYYFRIGARWDSVDEYYTIPALNLGKTQIIDEEKNRIADRGISRWANIHVKN